MAKFCGKCGSALVDNKCPACDIVKENIEPPTTVASVEQVAPVTTEVTVTTATDNNSTKLDQKNEKLKKKEEKKAKWQALSKKQKTTRIILKIVAWVLVAVVLTTVTLGTLVYFDVVKIPFINSALVKLGIKKEVLAPATSSEENIVFECNGRTLYSTECAVFDITDNDNPFVFPNEDHWLMLNNDKIVIHQNTIYGCFDDRSKTLYKYTVNKDTTEQVWVMPEVFAKAGFNTEYGSCTEGMFDFNLYKDNVYFCFNSMMGYRNEEQEILYSLGKINLDGDKVKLFDDICASALTTDDEWIYFFDNGYVSLYENDEDRVGIYKMKEDGKDKQLVYKIKTDSQDVLDTYTHLCTEMKIFDNYLYFIKKTNDSNQVGTIYRIDLSTNELEKVTDDRAANYTVDTQNNKLYYAKRIEMRLVYDIYELSLDSFEKTKLCKTSLYNLTLHNGYLYFSENDSHTLLYSYGHELCAVGARYKIDEEKCEILWKKIAFAPHEEYNPETGNFDFVAPTDPPEFYWEEIEPLNDGQFI